MHIHQLQYVPFNGGDCVWWKVMFSGTYMKYTRERADDHKTSPNGPLIVQTVTNPLYDTNLLIGWCHWETHINSNHNFQTLKRSFQCS